jgi:hypothetical protein
MVRMKTCFDQQYLKVALAHNGGKLCGLAFPYHARVLEEIHAVGVR